MDRLKNKVAIVTGGGSGIGAATSKLLAREGAAVAVVDVDEKNGHQVAAEIRDVGGEAGFWRMNISLENEVEATFAAVFKRFGRLDILVNNAGITGVAKPSHLITAEEWDAVMNINLRGTFFCTKHAVPYIQKSGRGSVINVSSIMGMMGGPAVVYNTSKAGIRHLTKSDALAYAKDQIRFNSVHPGFIVTPMFTNLASKSALGVEKSIELEGSRIPMGRMGQPEDIANGILFLASDDSSYVTGSEMVIDGGCVIK